MKFACAAAAVAAVLVGGAGCSSESGPADAHAGRMPPGVAKLTIDGKNAGRPEGVQCVSAKGTTAITIGAEPSVAAATISSVGALELEWARFRDANGFTGSYNQGLGGQARVTLIGSMYQIWGTASGFNASNPSKPTTAEFAMEVSC